MRIVTLLENTSCSSRLACQHGLSLYIELPDRRVLFDAGQTELFAQNAAELGIDLGRVDLAILSHGHYDHSGGMPRFRRENPRAPIYLSPFAFEPHYNASGIDIGADPALAGDPSLIRVEEAVHIGDTMTLYPAGLLPCPFPLEPWGLETVRGGIRVPEDFRHEQYLLIRHGGKNILFSGCSHKGILNIVEHFQPDILIGGFHLSKQTDPRALEAIARRLADYPTQYYTGHCTGDFAYTAMKPILGSRLHRLRTGTELTVSENGDII